MKLACFLLAALIPLAAQTPAQNPTVATVTFDQVWEAATPQEFIVTVKSDGTSTYLSRGVAKPAQAAEYREDKRWSEEKPPTPASDEKEPDYQVEFTISPGAAQRIFKDAEQANYFNGSFDYTKHQVARSGRKTLTFADSGRHFQTVFNYSENKAVEELAHLFQAISNTIEFGRKLEFKHKYDKLGLEADLKAMEDATEYHNLAELQIIGETLQSIADDTSVMNIARARAQRLLLKAANSK